MAPTTSSQPTKKPSTSMAPERKQSTVSPYPTLKKKNQQPLQDASNNQWLSRELDYNIKHFNELFIENLSQSLSAMLVKKPLNNDKTTPQIIIKDDPESNNANNISEFNPMLDQEDNTHRPDTQMNHEEEESSDSEAEHEEDIEHLIPQGEQEQQAVIESNEEVKQEDQKIRENLLQQEEQIVSLEDNLKDKETLLQAIKESHKILSGNLLEAMKMEYHKKIQSFQQEMQQLEQERHEQIKKADTMQQKSKLDEAYKKKLKDLEDKLKEAKQKEREQQQMQKNSSQHKQKIKTLESEIEKIKTQKVSLLKKMKEESDKHRKWKTEKVRELTQMKQSNVKKDREIQKLKRDFKRKEQLAKRKQDELSALMKKTKNDKQKQINAQKDRKQKKNIDIGFLQEWIITNTEKMLKYKELQQALEQELISKSTVEEQINEEQSQYAELSVRKEKLEFRKGQLEADDNINEDEIYQLNEEIEQITLEMGALQENIETYEEKNDFIDNKISNINTELFQFSPDDIQQLNFEEVQSIEGARACLGAFFGILLDVNVYKKQLEVQTFQNEATIESLNLQLEELKKIQQANEINFQKQIEQINKEYQEKEELLIKLIMENGGTEIEQLMQNININMQKSKSVSDTQVTNSQKAPLAQMKKQSSIYNAKKEEIQKNNQQLYNQSKTALSKRVAELERERKEESKKYETIKHKLEQSNAEKEVIKRQYEMMKSKIKQQDIQEIKQQRNTTAEEAAFYATIQKSPRNMNAQAQNNQKMFTLQEIRKERKIKKMAGGSQSISHTKPIIEPRVIADEPMEDDEEENPFQDKIRRANTNIESLTVQQVVNSMKSNESAVSEGSQQVNVFSRLSNTGNVKLPVSSLTVLNTSQTLPPVKPVQAQPEQIVSTMGYEEDNRWKCIFNKDNAHNGQICALASVGNQLYSTSNKSLRIWDLEKMQVVSDISAHSGFIKCMSIWEDKKLLLTASDKTILLWDMISLTQVGQLKGHKDEIRAMSVTLNGQLLFSAGKGSQNGGGLLIWDLRKGPQPVEEKEKNQDVFSLAMTPEFLFFGCRNHYVYPMNTKTFETIQPFEPPHFDVVTSLALLEDSLVSGSRDKNLRCWDYQNITNKYSDVMSAHSGWINTLETDYDHKEMYSGCKDGVVKVWKIKKKMLKCVAQLNTPSPGSINTLCRIDKQFGKMFASGSSDKQLRIWKYKNQGNESISNSPDQDDDMVDYDNLMDFNNDSNNEIDNQLLSQLNKSEESKQQQQQQQQQEQKMNIIVRSGTQVGYQPSQPSKLEQKRREKRLQDQQRKNYKENENYSQL